MHGSHGSQPLVACMVAKDPLLTSLSFQWLFLCGSFQFHSCQGLSGEMILASPLLCKQSGLWWHHWLVRHISGQLGALQPCCLEWTGLHTCKACPQA